MQELSLIQELHWHQDKEMADGTCDAGMLQMKGAAEHALQHTRKARGDGERVVSVV